MEEMEEVVVVKEKYNAVKREWETLEGRSEKENETMTALEKRWKAAEEKGRWSDRKPVALVEMKDIVKEASARNKYKALIQKWKALEGSSDVKEEMKMAMNKLQTRWKILQGRKIRRQISLERQKMEVADEKNVVVEKIAIGLGVVDEVKKVVDEMEGIVLRERYRALVEESEAVEGGSGEVYLFPWERRWEKLWEKERVLIEKRRRVNRELAANVILARVGDSSVHTQGSAGGEYVRGLDGEIAYRRVLKLAATNPNKLIAATQSLLTKKSKGEVPYVISMIKGSFKDLRLLTLA